MRAVVKCGAVGAMVPLAALNGVPLLALALAFSTWGDFALARPGDRWFLAGMVGFGAAHVLYAATFVSWGALGGLTGGTLLAVMLLVAVALWLGHRFSARAGALQWPVRIYVGLIAAMGTAALGLPPGLIPLGALLFILSDALIGQQMFLNRFWRGQDIAIWSSYYIAQACLLIGIAGTYHFL